MMSLETGRLASRIRQVLRSILMGPQALAFLPAFLLIGYWARGEGLLLYMALLFPAFVVLLSLATGAGFGPEARDGITGLQLRNTAIKALDEWLKTEADTGLATAALAISLDDLRSVERQFGARAGAMILVQTADRLQSTLRDMDLVVRLENGGFGVALSPMRRWDLETLIQLSTRLQAAIAEPFSIDATRVYVTASVGFCSHGGASDRTASAILESAEAALTSAQVNGAGSIRAYSPETKRRADARHALRGEIADAMAAGQIVPWFQPQVSTGDGAITGFEALARWEHPENGTILPADFLPALADLGLAERLGEVMLSKSLIAIRNWDKSNQVVPAVSVNFSSEELGDPKLCDKIKWELDRFELGPERLCVEIFEDVIADSLDDITVRNIAALSDLGCHVDLDNFGTGHASIANIRRFAVNRIKIDRSFVTRVDRDREQQNMVAAVLTMAERLHLDTLAEGVETVGEHAKLAQMGCGHVQGFSVARPMSFEATIDWLETYQAKRAAGLNSVLKTA